LIRQAAVPAPVTGFGDSVADEPAVIAGGEHRQDPGRSQASEIGLEIQLATGGRHGPGVVDHVAVMAGRQLLFVRQTFKGASSMAATDSAVAIPAGRASRASGRETRKALLRAATGLFLQHGEDVAIARICAAAGAHPNQVTYYFGSKERLFTEVACAAVLRAGKRAEVAALKADTVGEYTRSLVASLLGPGAASVELFVKAMLLAGRRPELTEPITATLRTLHTSGSDALLRTLIRTGWQLRAEIDVESRAFWSAIFGLVIQKAASGDAFGYRLEDAVSVVFTNLQISDSVLETSISRVG
jgi:AcrR family transcriptional regulator